MYVLNQQEADHVRTIFDTFLKTGSRAKTIKQLDILGIRPKLGQSSGNVTPLVRWNAQSLGNLLNSAAYLGCHEVNRRNKNQDQQLLKPIERYQLVKASWPAIINEKTFSHVQVLLEEAKDLERTRLKNSENRVYILSGLLRCGSCGGSLVGKTSHGSQAIHRYYGHTTAGGRNGCKIQRVSAEAIEKSVLDHLKVGVAHAGYFKKLGQAITESRSRAGVDQVRESRRVNQRLNELETQSANMFMMQGQQSMSADALKMLSDAIEKIAKERRALTEYQSQLSHQEDSIDSVAESVQSIRDHLNEFTRGFAKATGAQKKRLLRRLIKQLVLSKEGISIFYQLADEDETPGHKLQLVRDESQGNGKPPGFYLRKAGEEKVPKLSVFCSSIRKRGEPEAQLCNVG